MLHVFVYPQNMVGPGEVDEELEGETIEECSKYGKITKCTIFEVMTAQEKLVDSILKTLCCCRVDFADEIVV